MTNIPMSIPVLKSVYIIKTNKMTWEKQSGKSYDSFLADLDKSGYIVTSAVVMKRDEDGNPIEIVVSIKQK